MSTSQPTPSFSFTIPSLHDDIDLDCRIYNPPPSTLFPPDLEPPWSPRGAVIAHPYAPMGGCYDDWIVLAIVQECLKKGLVVGTFNFRGAPGSKSSTSWTSRAEVDDYISVTGLLIHYLETLISPLHPLSHPQQQQQSDPDTHHLTPIPSNTLPPPPPHPASPNQPIISLLLSGYSYGSLITSHLPPTPTILDLFSPPQTTTEPGSTPSEILARAHSLATQTLKDVHARRGRTLCMGGDETTAPGGSRRVSRDHSSRKSFDAIVRRSGDHHHHTRLSGERSSRRRLRMLGRRGSSSGASSVVVAGGVGDPAGEESGLRDRGMGGGVGVEVEVRTSYLLISPLLGTVAGLATMSLSTLLQWNPHSHHTPTHTATHMQHLPNNTSPNLIHNPTLVIYGTEDFFTSAKKVRRWCGALERESLSLSQQGKGEGGEGGFRSREVEGAGHFWREGGVEGVLRECVGGWVEDVVVQGFGDGE